MVVEEPADVRNWQRLGPTITTSGSLQVGDPQRLADIGVRHVINLALASHPDALPDAEAEMAAAGLRYTHIPVPFDTPDKGHYRRFKEALIEGEPTHVHCIMNWRVSAFFYRLHLEQGMDEGEARALLHRQWQPETSDYSGAEKWREFLGL